MSRLTELEAENAELQERVETAERYTAETLLRATRLNQVISLLAHRATSTRSSTVPRSSWRSCSAPTSRC